VEGTIFNRLRVKKKDFWSKNKQTIKLDMELKTPTSGMF